MSSVKKSKNQFDTLYLADITLESLVVLKRQWFLWNLLSSLPEHLSLWGGREVPTPFHAIGRDIWWKTEEWPWELWNWTLSAMKSCTTTRDLVRVRILWSLTNNNLTLLCMQDVFCSSLEHWLQNLLLLSAQNPAAQRQMNLWTWAITWAIILKTDLEFVNDQIEFQARSSPEQPALWEQDPLAVSQLSNQCYGCSYF